jgi:FMN-dependent oxidoreductase (nitrilotriacetate monooxygenase family)
MGSTDGKARKQIHLGAHFPGVNATTVWTDPRWQSMIDFSSFVHLAQTAERAKFDFFFLAEGLRLREKRGLIHDLDVVGRPDTLTVLAALAAVTERLGLIGTINASFNEPYEVARQFASLDQVSDGRAGWNVVTSSDAFTGENFRRGGYLPYTERYEHAGELLDVARALWNSWSASAVTADATTGRFLTDPAVGGFDRAGKYFDIRGQFTVPRTPQVEPVLLQAGDSEDGRDFGAQYADAIFTLPRTLVDAQIYYQQVKGRLSRFGRSPEDLLILPGVTFVLGDTTGDAQEKARQIRRQQVSGAAAIQYLEHVWNRDLSGYDPDGPLPEIDPVPGPVTIVQGQARIVRDPVATARQWREKAIVQGFSIREFVTEQSAHQTFIGTAAEVAEQIDERVQTDAADGFILVSHLSPTGLDEFADTVVPLLQERGSFRTEYAGTTLREHLGLPAAGTRRADLADRPNARLSTILSPSDFAPAGGTR